MRPCSFILTFYMFLLYNYITSRPPGWRVVERSGDDQVGQARYHPARRRILLVLPVQPAGGFSRCDQVGVPGTSASGTVLLTAVELNRPRHDSDSPLPGHSPLLPLIVPAPRSFSLPVRHFMSETSDHACAALHMDCSRCKTDGEKAALLKYQFVAN